MRSSSSTTQLFPNMANLNTVLFKFQQATEKERNNSDHVEKLRYFEEPRSQVFFSSLYVNVFSILVEDWLTEFIH